MNQIRVPAGADLPFPNPPIDITVALSDLAVTGDQNSLEDRCLESPFADFVWRIRVDPSTPFMFPAVSHWGIVVARQDGRASLSIIGPQTMARPARWQRDAELYGVSFKYGAYMPHFPPALARDRRVTLPDATSKAFWLDGSAWQCPDYNNVDLFVDRLAREGLLVLDQDVRAALQGQPVYHTARSLQYHALQATGVTRNFIRQLERARLAKALILHGASIADTVSQTGYFDQTHLNRSLKRFVGLTASEIQQLGKSQ